MTSIIPTTRQSLARATVLALLTAGILASTGLFAQTAAPAAAALPPGSRAAGPGGLTREQLNAAFRLDDAVAALNQTVAAARTNLNAAIYADPSDPATIKSKIDALAAAELALANARTAEFAKLQASPLKLTAEQVNTVMQNANRSGRAGGAAPTTVTRRPGFLANRAALLAQGGPQLVMLGDSITDGWRNTGSAVFTNAFVKYRTYNIGIGGIRTQDVANQIEAGDLDGTTPKAAMLMIGTNNLQGDSDESIAAGITQIIDALRKKLPNTRILLLGIFPRSMAADHPLRARIKTINGIVAKLDDGGKFVKYLDIGDKFLTADGTLTTQIMPDGLHPNAAGYQIWADAVKDVVAELVK